MLAAKAATVAMEKYMLIEGVLSCGFVDRDRRESGLLLLLERE